MLRMAMKMGLPVWELAIILIAIVLILVVFILWWLFGYKYVFEEAGNVARTLASTTTLLPA